MPQPLPIESTPDGVSIRIKVVPGASRQRIAGILGDRLKIAVSAPPEDGRANRAACELLADAFNVSAKHVTITDGHANPRKTVVIFGLSLCHATEKLARHLSG